LFVQVTVVPTAMLIDAGEKPPSVIETATPPPPPPPPPPGVGVFVGVAPPPPPPPAMVMVPVHSGVLLDR
jgi:hypothetical protein